MTTAERLLARARRAGLGEIAEKVVARERMSYEDGVTLYRFDNQSPAVPQVVLDSEALPVLGRMRTLQQRRHRGLGYVWQMQDHPLGGSEYILLVDGDDDAAFDGEPLVGNRKWYEAAGFANHESWGDGTDPLRR